MKKYYYELGLFLLILTSLTLFILGSFLIEILLGILGITFIIISDKKWWIKLLTIIVVPPVVAYGAVFLILALSGNTF